eukprot:SAG31_NODE_9129_length_1329_cov_1.491057_1_plen_38_part_10
MHQLEDPLRVAQLHGIDVHEGLQSDTFLISAVFLSIKV